MLEMDSKFLTGIEQIDAEHSRLFEIINDLYDLLMQEFLSDKFDQITEALERLKDYTKYHFQHEEAYMEEIGYKKRFTQKVQHDQFIAYLEEVDLSNYDIIEEQDKVVNDLLDFLIDWLTSHILEQDKLIRK